MIVEDSEALLWQWSAVARWPARDNGSVLLACVKAEAPS